MKKEKIPGAQMTSIVIWAQCGSFAAVCGVIQYRSGHGSGGSGS